MRVEMTHAEDCDMDQDCSCGSGSAALVLSEAEVEMLLEALDSHSYWQLSDPWYRDSGGIKEPGSDDPEAARGLRLARALEEKIHGALREKRAASEKTGSD